MIAIMLLITVMVWVALLFGWAQISEKITKENDDG